VEIIEALMRTLPDPALRQIMGDAGPELARLAPRLRDRFPDLPEPMELAPELQQRYLFNALLDFTRHLCQAVPCVILLDDLHWADDSSMALLEHIAPHVSDLPLLYVVTYRDVAADMGPPFRRALANLNRQHFVTRLPVRQLTVEAVGDMLATLGGPSPPANLVQIIHGESGGNALFVQSVYQSLAEEGRLFDAGGAWRSDLTREDLVVPDDIRLIIERRVERLDAETRKLLVMAAVLGLRFDPDVLEKALDADGDLVLDGIEEAEAANLVFPAPGGRESRYEFSHALVRQSLLDMTTPLRRERLHRQAADATEALFGEDPAHAAAMARHLLAAGRRADNERKRRFLLLAAEHATEASSFDEAVSHYDQALELTAGDDVRGRARVLARRGYGHRALGDWTQSESDWLEALALLAEDQEADRDTIARLSWEVGFQLIWQNRLDEGEALLERALDLVGDAPSAGRARLLALLGHFLTNSGRLSEGDRLQREAIGMARDLGDLRLLGGDIMFSRLYHFQHTCEMGRFAATVEESMALLEVHGSGAEASRTVGCAIVAYVCTGNFSQAQASRDRVLPLALASGDAGSLAHVELFGAMVDTAEGHFQQSRARSVKAVRIYRETGMPWVSAAMAASTGTAILLGDWETAETECRYAVDHAVDCPTFDGYEKSQLLYIRTLMGDERASELLDEYEDLLPGLGRLNSLGSWHMLMSWIECAALLKQHERAAKRYDSVLEFIVEQNVITYYPCLVQKIAGIAAFCGERYAEASVHFDAAARQAKELPFVSEQGEVRRWRATMLLHRDAPGDRDAAQGLLKEAIAVYERYGMPKHAALAQSSLEASASMDRA
jgi:tetratricopeptide (TPR) repeat protein